MMNYLGLSKKKSNKKKLKKLKRKIYQLELDSEKMKEKIETLYDIFPFNKKVTGKKIDGIDDDLFKIK